MNSRAFLRLRIVLCLAVCASLTFSLAACTPPISKQLDPTMTVAHVRPSPWPSAQVAAPDAPPRIEKIWFSSLHLREGSQITGAAATSTNVASLEIRTATFSINAPRSSFGQFTFQLRVLVFPPLLKHTYPVLIIARNAAGVEEIKHAYLIVE